MRNQQKIISKSTMKTIDGRTDISLAYDGILAMIAAGELRPGERTSVIALADRLKLGRTPVKEAITRLATAGLLVVKGRSGTSVADINEEKVRQLFGIRRVLEDYAAAEAVNHATPQDIRNIEASLSAMRKASQGANANISDFINADVSFHTNLVAAAKNPILNFLYASVKMHVQIVVYLHYSGPGNSTDRNKEHKNILEMLKSKDRTGLQRALRSHSLTVEKEIMKALSEKQFNPSVTRTARLGQMPVLS